MLDLNLEHHDDQDHEHHLFSPKLQSSSSSSSLSNPIFFMTPSQDQPNFYMESHPQQQDCKIVSQGCDQETATAVEVDESDNGLKFTIRRRSESSNEYETENNSVKWMSSKMRMMRKMISSDTITNFTTTAATTTKLDHQNHNNKLQQQQQPSSPPETDNSSNSSSCNNSVRVCSDCNTTKTPLWRSGPRGPKSLCNACGIRQRKARRAMAAAAAANGTIAPVTNPPAKKVQHKNKRSSLNHNNQVPQLKKRCKISAAPPGAATSGRKKICFEDLRISLSKSSAFQQVFPQDEKEAAILLMALSYGLVHG